MNKNLFLTFILGILHPLLLTAAPGLKTYNEFYQSLISITGIKPTPAIKASYEKNKTILPKFGTMDEFNDAVIRASSDLGGHFCKARIDLDSTLPPSGRWAHAKIDFSTIPSDLSKVDAASVASEYAAYFWQRTLTEQEKTLFAIFWEEGIKNLPPTIENLKLLFLAQCGVFVSSLNFVMN